MLIKKFSKVISICLFVAMLLVTFAIGLVPQPVIAMDSLEQMKDEPIQEVSPHELNSYPREEIAGVPIDSADFLMPEEALAHNPYDYQSLDTDQDASKTNRYIVKYKANKEMSFKTKISTVLDEALDIAPALTADSGVLSIADSKSNTQSSKLQINDRMLVELPVDNVTNNMEVLILEEKKLPSEFVAEIKAMGADKDIEYIQPDYELSLDSLGLELIDDAADPALDVESEGPVLTDTAIELEAEEIEKPEIEVDSKQNVLVAVIDTGMDTSHEIFDGYLYEETPDMTTDLLSYAHGTHIGGIIAKTAKDTSADVKIMPIRAFDNGNAYTSDIIAAIEYATASGARIINCSFGSTNNNTALYETIAASDALFVCAVGNNRRDFDAVPSYPAGYDLPNVISVASVNADDGFSYFSNYGQNSIDIAAYGRDVYSSLPGNTYGNMTGASMSAAYVSGVAAVVLSAEHIDPAALRERLIDSADRLANLQDKVVGGRRVNIENSIIGIEGRELIATYEEDFDVFKFMPTPEESFALFSMREAIQVEVGDTYSVALCNDGTVWTWGYGPNGELGVGDIIQSRVPVQVIGLQNVVEISTGRWHTLALKSDGTVWAWGLNDLGQLGIGSWKDTRNVPVQVIGIQRVEDIDASSSHSLAYIHDGLLFGWGRNAEIQIKTSQNLKFITTPVEVAWINGIFAAGDNYSVVSYGDYTGDIRGFYHGFFRFMTQNMHATQFVASPEYFFELTDYGYVYRYIANATKPAGEFILDSEETNKIIKIFAVDNYLLVLKEDGTVLSWGDNSQLRLNGYPSVIEGISNVVNIGVGTNHTLVLKSDGSIWGWGSNLNEQLGVERAKTLATFSPIECFPEDVMPLEYISKLELNIVEGAQYLVRVNGKDITPFAVMTLTFTYDPSNLALVNAAAQVHGTNTVAGANAGIGITIMDTSPGHIALTIDRDIPQGMSWSGAITVLQFEAIATGTTTITMQ